MGKDSSRLITKLGAGTLQGQAMDTMSDRRAIALCQSESDHGHAAFRVLYDRYYDAVRRYVRRFISDSQQIDDVVQECFVKFYRSRQRIKADLPLRPYLFKIAHNAALSSLQKKKPAQAGDIALEQLAGVDNSVVQRELNQGISQALLALAPEHRAVLTLRHIDQLKMTEIAEALSCSERTARNRLRAAAVLFARQLQALGLLGEDHQHNLQQEGEDS